MANVSKCIIITGLSGAGKSTALRILEDRGFFACDNLPPILMPRLMEVLEGSESAVGVGVAVVIDIRGEGLLEDLFASIQTLRHLVRDVTLVFLDASDDWLVRRYETTRRRHPLGKGVTILEGIAKERRRLTVIRERSDIVMDTSSTMPNDLGNELLFELGVNDEPLTVVVSSFGFKYGVPRDCDYMFDARFLPNPNYVQELKKLSGRDAAVQEYLDRVPAKRHFIEHVKSLIEFVLMQYDNTGKKQVHIAFGCTGGRHRSVAVAEAVSAYLLRSGHKVATEHRDITKESE
jgi:UPF0042 nucleotide-binding protein